LQAIAEQGHLLFGEHGLLPTAASVFDHADTLAGFLGSINDIAQFFLGNPEVEKKPPKKEAEQIIKIFEPIAKDSDSQLDMQINGPVTIGEIHYHFNSQQANAVQNRARQYLGPTIPTNTTLHDEVLTLIQMRGDPKARVGDKGVIESISKTAVKLAFGSEQIKKDIVESPDNPFQRAFIVDVDVRTADGKPALYKILALKDSFDKP
jgi:hypothetical protein